MEVSPFESTAGKRTLVEAYDRMRAHFGFQDWWPADSPFEVCVGAILTQNTAWTNVERALRALKAAGLLSPLALHGVSETRLAELIRPAGTFRVKARRLRSFLAVLVGEFSGDLSDLLAGATETVRLRLLGIPGIGPETADCMLLYASDHERFVIDAYTQRIFFRHQWASPGTSYTDLQRLCQVGLVSTLPYSRLELWRDAHAQFVMAGKHYCRRRAPRCLECPLLPLLPKGLPLPI